MGTIRIICHKGKYKLFRVKCDEDGNVEKVCDEVEFTGRCAKELRHLVEEALQGMAQGVVMLTACNERGMRED